MNGAEASLGSTGVGTGVGVMPNGKALLDGSAVAVVGVGRLNLNPPTLVAEAGAGAGTSAFGAGTGAGAGAAGSAPKVNPVTLAPVDPIAGNSNSFGAGVLDLSPASSGGVMPGNDGMVIGVMVVVGVADEVGANSFIGDPLSISSSRGGGVLVLNRAIAVGCGLGAAVGAVNTIVGARVERVMGTEWALNSGAGLA